MNSRLLRTISFAITCCLFVSYALADPKVSPPKKSQATLKKELHAKKSRLAKIKKQIRQKRSEVHEKRQDMREVDARLDRITGSLVRTKNQLADSQQRLLTVTVENSQAALNLVIRQDQFGRRLRTIYKQGDSRFVSALVGTQSVSDLASRSYILRRIAERDRKIADDYQDAKRDLDAKRAEQAELVQRVKSSLARLAEQEQSLQVALDDKKTAYRQSVQELASQEAQYAEENAATLQIEAELQRYYATPQSSTVRPWKGGFIRPVNGPVTSGYGYRFHPILHTRKLHTGIDLGSPQGTPIKAAAGGRVIKAEYYRGYGNCVIIDHGGGTSTLYGHCSALLVSVGQNVQQGQIIARVGSTGLATGPHLHFEVRRFGKPVPPN